MVKTDLTLVNRHGLHLRPASKFVEIANRYPAEVFVSVNGGDEGNGKSILDLSARAAGKGAILSIRAVGEGAEQAVEELSALIRSGFGELSEE
jgi:phosphocarrier protein